MNYYNEFEPKAAAGLRQLIEEGFIPHGHVDTRSIEEVQPADLRGYTQCHFFAGIGGWSYALQLARWPADRHVWTGSCPCQPFSTAGKKKGKTDERHLWPVWFELIRKSRPPIVFGEQVSAAIRHGWWDDVADDLEGEGYTTRAEIRPACGIGAPHKRDRLWFVANAEGERSGRAERSSCETSGRSTTGNSMQSGGTGAQCSSMGNTEHDGSYGRQITGSDGQTVSNNAQKQNMPEQFAGAGQSCDVSGHWRGEWISCPDGKQRLIEPRIRLLVDGFPERVGLLRAAGNAIVAQVAAEFIKAYMDI